MPGGSDVRGLDDPRKGRPTHEFRLLLQCLREEVDERLVQERVNLGLV